MADTKDNLYRQTFIVLFFVYLFLRIQAALQRGAIMLLSGRAAFCVHRFKKGQGIGKVDGTGKWEEDIMLCERCGASLEEGSKFCTSCGVVWEVVDISGSRRYKMGSLGVTFFTFPVSLSFLSWKRFVICMSGAVAGVKLEIVRHPHVKKYPAQQFFCHAGLQ